MTIRKPFQRRLANRYKEEHVTSPVLKTVSEHNEAGFCLSPSKTGKDAEKIMASLGGRGVRWVSS